MKKESYQAINVTLKKAGPAGSSNSEPLATLAQEELIFLGDSGNPFLAPRGVCLVGQQLFVADTGQNRVFIWHQLPTQPFQKPDVVLGQADQTATARNEGGAVNAASLQYPSGLWSDGKRLIVADAWNHRVLIWHTIPTQDGQPADTVIGQPDMLSNQPNVAGIGHAPSAQSLHWPYGLSVYDDRLFIADTGNRRVLLYNQIPTKHFVAADAVIGKRHFNDRDYEAEDPIWPYSVKFGPHGQMAITDTQYYRVLLWEHWTQAFTQKANILIGQPNRESNGQNQFQLYPAAHTLNWCYDAVFYKEGIFVVDTGNSRLLWFSALPSANNAAANNLIGKPNFQTGSENADTVFGTEKSLYWPFAASIDPLQERIAVADTGNHRIVFYKLQIS